MPLVTFIGAVLAFVGVALGAFGAHGLSRRVSADRIKTYQTGVQYQLVHALAILITGLIATRHAHVALLVVAGWLFVAGIVLFSGSLYALTFAKLPGRGGLITPLGGLLFLSGWFCLLIDLARSIG